MLERDFFAFQDRKPSNREKILDNLEDIGDNLSTEAVYARFVSLFNQASKVPDYGFWFIWISVSL